MANIQISRLGCVVLSDCISTTGKWYCYLGEHLIKGVPCYDVCAMAQTGDMKGVAFRRHYRDDKVGALAYWDTFREQMTAPRPNDQSDEPTERMIIRDGTTDEPEEFIN